MPIVSVITPTYKRPQMLKRMIKSVLAQRFQDWELIVVDDCSPNGDAKDIISGFNDNRIKYIKLGRNTGGSYAPRLKGLETSTGKFIAVLDDDDTWMDDRKLEMQVEYFDKNPSCVLVGTDIIRSNSNGDGISHVHFPKDDMAIRSRLLASNCFCHSAVMYRRATIDKIGYYKRFTSGFYKNQCNEYDLWLRMGLIGKFANLPIYGVNYYVETRNISASEKFGFLKLYLATVMPYRSNYPHWIWAVMVQCGFTVFDSIRSIKKKRE